MLRLVLIMLLVIGSAYAVPAKEWRGLVPLRSKREDVEKLLGQPPLPPKGSGVTLNKGRSIYSLDEAEVHIVFAEEGFNSPRECLMTVAPGTVLMIQVTPKTRLLISDLKIDEKRFRKFDPSQSPGSGHEAYLNEEEGFIVRAFRGEIDQLIYVASALDNPQCPTYYENLERFVDAFVCGLSLSRKFDEYGDISFSDEKARLDNFAIELQNQVDGRGYIILYAGRKAFFAEAQTRGNRAKEYLVNVRGLTADRVVTIDGGYRDSFSVELFIGAQDADAPTPSPTIEASQVEIIYEKKPRSRVKPH